MGIWNPILSFLYSILRDAPGGVVRKFFLAVYVLGNVLFATALILLVVLAPVRDVLAKLKGDT